MKKSHKSNFLNKNSEKSKNKIDKLLSAVHTLLSEYSNRKHTGNIKVVVNMNDGVPIDVKAVLEVEEPLRPE
ncbi:MAG: hypothetical protein LBB66_04480 [Desulfovibrio sp.]|jgi:hypothetical protein|nr:hypothetical protein [Desulfovibrio sp.]